MISRHGIGRFSTWGRAFAVLVLPLVVVATANAQWTVVNLHPAGSSSSFANGVSGGQQVGNTHLGHDRASLWSGTAASWVDLSPAGSLHSYAYGVSGGQQVGRVDVGGVARASLWNGTAASWVDLHPAGTSWSTASGVGGGQQVGYAEVGNFARASLWNGTAASWVDLSPAGSSSSFAKGVSGGQQVGYAIVGGAYRASLWSGTAASWVDLSPAGARESIAHGVYGGQQVGYAIVGGAYRASLWSGTAASWVDLSPAGSLHSFAYGVYGGQQVGWAHVGFVYRASLWSGTAASWVDLHAFLPSNFSSSEARGIWSDGIHTYVVGYGFNSTTYRNEALMWVGPPPSPSGIRSLEFVPNVIGPTGSSQARAVTWGNVTKVTLRADPGQGVPTTAIKMVRSGDTWTASISGLSLTKRNRNPVSFTATATTTDSGNPTASASLSIVDPGAFVGLRADTGQTVRGIVCDNPADFDNRAPTEPAILAMADKLELVLPSGMTAQSDQGSVCLNGNGTSVDRNGDPNAGSIIVSDGKVYFLPPDEFSETQRPTSIGDVTVRPMRNVTVRATIKLTDNRVIAFNAMTVTLARPVVVLIHGINSSSDVWSQFVVGPGGVYLNGPRVPYVTIDHKSRDSGNGPVEYGAMLLKNAVDTVLHNLRWGSFVSEQMTLSRHLYSFYDYYRRPLASKRVDLVAHSYGGMIARWYMGSSGDQASLSWYQRAGTNTSGITSTTYGDDVRKLITLGSMWRGVPLASYVNEVNFNRAGSFGRMFREAPMDNVPGNLGWWIDNVFDNLPSFAGTKVPSMEVMAVESPWLRNLIYRDPFVTNTDPRPFRDEIGYGSVAGHWERYFSLDEGMYGYIDNAQQPTWFSPLRDEWRQTPDDDDPGYSDGIVPVWSAAIPGSYVTVQASHSKFGVEPIEKGLPGNPDSHAYTIQWLNHAGLPSGASLNQTWQNNATINDPASGGSWSFFTWRMTPISLTNAYEQSNGIGRLNPSFWSH